MVELNFDRHRPAALLDLTRVARAARVGAGGRAHPARRGGHLQPDHRRARRPAARAGDGLAHGRLAADPQPGHGRRQPRRRVPGRRLAPAAAGRGRGGRGRVGARAPGSSRSTDFYTGVKRNALAPDELIKAVLITAAGRAAAVLQDRHPQRDGDRGGRRSASPCTPTAGRSAPASARRRRRRAGRWPPSSSWPRRWPRPGCGSRADRCPTRSPASSATWSRPPPRRSTTSAARRGLPACTRCP